MSECIWPHVGTADAQFGDAVSVHRDPATGDVRLGLDLAAGRDDEDPFTWLTPGQLDKLRELLDRAAMPGQVSG